MNPLWRARLRLLAELVVLAYLVLSSYGGRVEQRNSTVAGCERGKLDRAANAAGWRTAETARRASGTPNDLIAAARYDRIASGLETRSRIDCAVAFPKPSLLP